MTQPTNNNSSLLRDARESKGLTLEIVHEATKIPLDALKAIEQGYSTRILTPFYYKGFIKIYAEFLGLDVNEALKAYHVEKKPAVKVAPQVIKRPHRVKAQPQVIEKAQHRTTGLNRKNRNLLAKIFMAIAIIVVLILVFRWIGGILNNVSKNAKPKVTHIQNNVKVEKQEKPKKVVEVNTKNEVVPFKLIRAESSNLKVGLTVRAVKDSWIQVKVDGKVAYAMTINKGTMENWVAYNQIELSGRNISELDLEVNGKHLGVLGSSDRSAKRVVITRQGLTVKK